MSPEAAPSSLTNFSLLPASLPASLPAPSPLGPGGLNGGLGEGCGSDVGGAEELRVVIQRQQAELAQLRAECDALRKMANKEH
jgi:hypothetical protein